MLLRFFFLASLFSPRPAQLIYADNFHRADGPLIVPWAGTGMLISNSEKKRGALESLRPPPCPMLSHPPSPTLPSADRLCCDDHGTAFLHLAIPHATSANFTFSPGPAAGQLALFALKPPGDDILLAGCDLTADPPGTCLPIIRYASAASKSATSLEDLPGVSGEPVALTPGELYTFNVAWAAAGSKPAEADSFISLNVTLTDAAGASLSAISSDTPSAPATYVGLVFRGNGTAICATEVRVDA